ncbi:hypothetical protein PHYSODRAFT_320426 [Phytophthora sojae]|uniref:Uncharacterized protein n=1 Tax=Phytophthora sojae (strain P6497) TaxID=1094619 RepID=G4YFD1_PHYSP|nr:hypothetical protein PHYSODRAFT_320426 [Phytophthora sojae]EGZ26490.1 hypothetical protein PHYSODRAFT_320426 [Phytophthora sojae]|eukprot:XP_009513765.1 hypothetical protein PHYSODRAFT_320426 [Phytophthora sojae]
MAILAYVNFKREGLVSSYASDPVLALGAMKVCAGSGEVGEMVARILLLLAMDKCVMGDKDFSQCYHTIGQFVPVQQFLDVLQGNKERPIYRKKMDSEITKGPEFKVRRSKWEGWYVGFTHFVQLHLEPNEDTLWFLLGRRAAGIFPRNQSGADLLIPMFKKRSNSRPVGGETTRGEQEGHEVLMMLIQNQLSFTGVHDTIRIYMTARGQEADGNCIYTTTMKDSLQKSPHQRGEATAKEDGMEAVGGNTVGASEMRAESLAKNETNPGVTIISEETQEGKEKEPRRILVPERSMLANMVKSQYDPLGLVVDDRGDDEKQSVSSYAKLSVTANSAKLLKSARKALACAPGCSSKNFGVNAVDDGSKGTSHCHNKGGDTIKRPREKKLEQSQGRKRAKCER